VKRILLVVLVACGGSPAPKHERPPPRPTYDPRELAELADGFFDLLATTAEVVEAHPNDCPGMAKELDQMLETSAPITTRMKEVAADPDGARALNDQMKRHDADTPAIVDRISKGLAPCAGDPTVRNAVDKMPVF
jgi:hypothetical protein